MEQKVLRYPVLLILVLGTYSITPVQTSTCVTRAETQTIQASNAYVQEPCIEPTCPQDLICPQDGCRTATVTRTVQVPSTWVKPVVSPQSPCYYLSCTFPNIRTITCDNQVACRGTVTTTQISIANEPWFGQGLPCFKPECPRSFVCPYDGCQDATLTETIIDSVSTVQSIYSSARLCYTMSCVSFPVETVSCNTGSTLGFPLHIPLPHHVTTSHIFTP